MCGSCRTFLDTARIEEFPAEMRHRESQVRTEEKINEQGRMRLPMV
jgi:hypothetical protein